MRELDLAINQLVPLAHRDLLGFPRPSLTKRLRYFKLNTKQLLKGEPPYPLRFYSWPNALIFQALVLSHNLGRDDRSVLLKYSKQLSKQRLEVLDQTMNGLALIDLVQMERDSGAESTIHRYACFLMNHPLDALGSLPYRKVKPDYNYVDTIGMVCPFLVRYAEKYYAPEALNLALVQLKNFLQNGMDVNSGLPYHGYDPSTSEKKGPVGWGRGVGWLFLGLVGVLTYLDRGHPDYSWVMKAFADLHKNVMRFQDHDGYFHWRLDETQLTIDSSATSMILYAIAEGVKQGLLQKDLFTPMLTKGVEAIVKCITPQGVDHASAECGGFGIYPQRYGCYPWSLGPSLAFLITAKSIDA